MYGQQYSYKSYFDTPEFQVEVEQFASLLSMFELHDFSLAEGKKLITVSDEEINEHRYRYGTLPEQVENIKGQYEGLIQDAIDTDNQEAADLYIAERDSKIEDITKNFQSDEHIRQKIVKEKEAQLEEYFQEKERSRSDYLRYKKTFSYYFKDNVTGQVFTNVEGSKKESAQARFDSKDMKYVQEYSISPNYSAPGNADFEELLNTISPVKNETFDGQIGVSKNISPSSSLMKRYEDFKINQILLLIYSIGGVVLLILYIIIGNRSKAIQDTIDKWKPYYNKLPIDVRMVFFLLTGLGAIITFWGVGDNLFLAIKYLENRVDLILFLISSSLLSGLAFLQGKVLASVLKDWQSVKQQWKEGLFHRGWKQLQHLSVRMAQSLKEAFLNQSVAIQVFILLAIVFGLGIAAVLIFIHPLFLLFYLILLAIVGIPVVMMLVKNLGYFNRIVEKTSELAIGNLGQDLPVTGTSVLATLAGNVNELREGVKTSISEQAKSERLKTELITNVSHDLRTPLTSIITYTELLKKGGISSEDKSAYLEIIDRKSKRLKVLIDDLFEVSKMASGNIELKKERVDLSQLLQQSLAEYDDLINESSLQFRVTNSDKPVFALVDGQKLWRVFDNLIGNILKYSLENSRVYISLTSRNNDAEITFKNVSKYELNDNSEELYERFKRGDKSRHTEGSGLGLAIAKSIVDLHEGRFEIETDGDLFKVIVSLRQEG
jgi:signal transduction histidine kinase